MTKYIIDRLIQAVIVVIIATLIVFILVRFLPGDPILLYISGAQLQTASPERIAAMRQEFGLDQPLIMQYLNWIWDLLHGDLGKSIFYQQPVSKLIGERLPTTLHIGLLAFIFSSVLGITAGTLTAVRRGKWLDYVTTVLANLGICIPVFWLCILLMYFFAFKLGWVPLGGYTSPFDNFIQSTRQLILPVFCLMLFGLAADARQTRSSMLEVIYRDYVRTAYSKGLSERVVIMRHVFKNGITPIVTFKGMAFSQILGGSVFVESVFYINGVGRLAAQAVTSQDYAIVQAIVLLSAVITVLVNILVDISYVWLDPRVRYN